ncbi:MAG: RidA family protein [Deltaproteobacteria bacterium]|jgi:2-iminobutanoate/2-iminopropanoate deaminase|nr:RidA family protein [Deltaproteobacteria bacterium]MBW2531344.1 RidA family protein [Deltaproteobacteria bacterium]
MSKEGVQTTAAPQAIGPYSQAVRFDSLVFCSGQIALDPATGAMSEAGVAEQTRRVMDNLGAVLSAAGASFDEVVKTTIYLTDLADFQIVNDVYASYFGDTPPARATVEVAALPKGAAVEIDAIACVAGR